MLHGECVPLFLTTAEGKCVLAHKHNIIIRLEDPVPTLGERTTEFLAKVDELNKMAQDLERAGVVIMVDAFMHHGPDLVRYGQLCIKSMSYKEDLFVRPEAPEE
jgi:hypothetical protein